jgi:hypothetical protein
MYARLFSLQNKLNKNDEINALKNKLQNQLEQCMHIFFLCKKKIDKNDEFHALKNKLQNQL